MKLNQIGLGINLLMSVMLASWSQNADALALDKSSKVSVSIGNNLSVDLYAKYVKKKAENDDKDNKKVTRQSRDYYYVPSRVRISAGPRDEPQLTILTYVSDGSEGASGGTFNAMVTWDLTEDEKRKVAAQLRRKVRGARLRGPVPLETATSGQSVSVLVALGGEEKVAWSGRAPTQSGGRAAIAANLSSTGATLLDSGISDGNLAGISVSMDYQVPFKVNLGRCTVTIDWDRLSASFDYQSYSRHVRRNWIGKKKGVKERGFEMAIGWGQQNGMISNDCDYSRIDPEQMAFFESAISSFLNAKIKATAEAEKAREDAPEDEEQNDGDQNNKIGPKPSSDNYSFRYAKFLMESFRGKEVFEITRAIEVLEPIGPVVGNVKEWITGYEDSDGVRIKSVNLSNTEFSQVPVNFTLGTNAIDMFGIQDDVKAQLNSVVVTLKKPRENGSDFLRSHTFTRKSIEDGETNTVFEYARGASVEPINYQYAVQWNYVGRKPKAQKYISSESGAHVLEPNIKSVELSFAVDQDQLLDNKIMGATAEVQHRFLGKDRTSYLNLVAGDEPVAKAVVFVDQDTPHVAFRTVFTHQRHGQMVGNDWKPYSVPNSGGLQLFGIVPDEFIEEEVAFIDRAKASVTETAKKKLDDVLEEFGKL